MAISYGQVAFMAYFSLVAPVDSLLTGPASAWLQITDSDRCSWERVARVVLDYDPEKEII